MTLTRYHVTFDTYARKFELKIAQFCGTHIFKKWFCASILVSRGPRLRLQTLLAKQVRGSVIIIRRIFFLFFKLMTKDEKRQSITSMKSDRDLQGEGGGGLSVNNAYSNPALSNSTASVGGLPQSEFKGSNDFILVEEHKKRPAVEVIKSIFPWAKKKTQSAFRKKMLFKRFPILNWLPKYNSADALGDLVAGITVGLMVIPQSLAYSNVAGLPAHYGLYGSFLGCIVYIFLGTCKDVPFGPSAISSLMTFQVVQGKGPIYAILLCFISGIVEVLMGLFGLGFIIDFVSGPVSSGFTSAAALIIITSQIKDLFGIQATGNTFVNIWTSVFSDIHNTRGWDAALGFTCIAVLLIMRIVATLRIGPPEPTGDEKVDENDRPTLFHKVVNKLLWLFGTSRNAIVVLVCGGIGYSFFLNGEPPFKLIGYIPPGLPDFQIPPFGFDDGNSTASFVEMIASLGSGVIVVPLLALLEDIAICKAFATGKAVDATQELIAIGTANIACSFVQSFPGTGSLSRSAVNNASGVRTPLGGLYTAILVILSLLFFTPYFFYIPKASLAAVIIAAVIFMVEVRVVKPMWRAKKSDLIPGIGTFICCLALPLEMGILAGIGINLLFILYHAARPKISIEKLTSQGGVEYLMLTPDRCLIFPSVDYVRNLVTKQSIRQAIPVVIDCTHIYGADFTAATVVETLTHDFVARDQRLFFYNLKPSVCAVFEGVSPKEFVVYYNEDDLDNLLKDKSYFKPADGFPV